MSQTPSVRCLALAALVLGLLALPVAAGAKQPVWTAQGTVTSLHPRSISVHGHTCRLAGALGQYVYGRWATGDGAKIACTSGVLRRIAVLALPTIIVSSPAPPAVPGAPSTGISISSGSSFSNGSGAIAVTAISSDSITLAPAFAPQPGGPVQASYTCSIGASSPDVSGLQVGDRIRGFSCRDDILVGLTRA